MRKPVTTACAVISIIVIACLAIMQFQSTQVQATNAKPGCYANPQGECSVKDLALCLTDKGVKFYGAYWCGHCANQKAAFGGAAQFLPYVECDLGQGTNQRVSNPVCEKASIRGFPTWVFPDGTRLEGEQPLSTLGEQSGCFDYGWYE